MAETSLLDELSVHSIVEYPYYMMGRINCWVDLKITTPVSYTDIQARPTIDLVVVVDRSRSMRGKNISLVKQSLCFILSQLNTEDRLAVVVYDKTAQIIFPFTPVTSQVRDRLFVRIESISIGKGTNICEGLLTGIQLLNGRKTSTNRQVSSLLLFSDGFPTVGILNKEDIVKQILSTTNHNFFNLIAGIKRRDPFMISTVGLAAKHDPNMLQAISQRGNGTFYSIPSAEQIPTFVAEFLGGLLSTFAQEICLDITMDNGAKLERFYVREDSEFNDNSARVVIRDIQLGEDRDILLVLILPRHEGKEAEVSYLTVQASYTLFDKMVRTDARVLITRSLGFEINRHVSTEVSIQRNRWRAVESLREAKEQASLGNKPEAKRTLEKCKLYINNSETSEAMLSDWLIEDLNRIIKELDKEELLKTSGISLLTATLESHSRQRSCSCGTGVYITPSRVNMITENDHFNI
ncbi:hypothetical protein LOD99_3380 [Oopsacas minuta]|uniref:VWFA domain-containing protein n=1 Tax=Oopsacas minuta TaxID=111878 RepID=A0AAV7JYB3_9METZ|nr:hypothetical protein LOD99_3380 [Oopsacas minuta]